MARIQYQDDSVPFTFPFIVTMIFCGGAAIAAMIFAKLAPPRPLTPVALIASIRVPEVFPGDRASE